MNPGGCDHNFWCYECQNLYRGKEDQARIILQMEKFLTEDLAEWCKSRGIEEEYKTFLQVTLSMTGRSNG